MIIRSPRLEANFTVVSNAVIRDERLSFRARGLLINILSRPDDWTVSAESLAKRGKEGRDAVLTALDELRAAGYLVTTKRQAINGKFTTVSIVYDTPTDALIQKPTPEKPTPGKPKAENQGSLEVLPTKNYKEELKIKSVVEQSSPEISEICYYLAKAIELRGLKSRPREDHINGSMWLSEARLLLEGKIGYKDTREDDGRLSVTQIKGAIDFAMADKFWAGVIFSPAALRRDYPRLRIAAKLAQEKRAPKGLSAIMEIREEESRKVCQNALE